MFYAHFILSKKGPLAKVWLAAHWDKKLTKQHVFETSIEGSVESILHPKVKMALRTSGHLLLGVVRIHNRKAKYLLADCNEAFVKIKMAFRPGVVDLPEENREAAVATITLPEVFHDFDTTVPDLNDFDMQAFTMNQSRVEEITMREDVGNINMMETDAFGDLPFDDKEMLRDASNMDETLYNTADASNLLLDSDHNKKDETVEKRHPELRYDDPIKDDFGGAPGDGILGADFLGATAGDLFGEAPGATGDISIGPEIAATPIPEQANDKERAGPSGELQPDQNATAVADQTTLVPNEREAFALEPLEVTGPAPAVAGVKETRVRKKRKLIVDPVIELASSEIRAQLEDTSDIVTTLDLAPPTKKLMQWKEMGGVDKLFTMPCRAVGAKVLLAIFHRNLTTVIPEDLREEKGSTVDDEERMETESTEMGRDDIYDDGPMSFGGPASVSSLGSVPEPLPMGDDDDDDDLPPKSVEPPEVPERRPSPAPEEQNQLGGVEDLFGGAADSPAVDLPPMSPVKTPSSSPRKSYRPRGGGGGDSSHTNETEEEQEERRLNKRTTQMLHVMDRTMGSAGSITFFEMTKKHTRKQAASKFYTLLVLKKQTAIEVEQKEHFSDILITKGPKFNSLVGA
ncbi:double-strand-break repair protein rad21 homolog [Branchiostoma floridae]|uniref:Double-strand-break repair protein rad21 homolog n=1 Tax=Branchiostoma floridae TaxID=7739 RepID=A0A9J7KHH8_BRAFL|nr:double-strand-break repair protein rad21 homolog [Branchiostoma floridae]